MTLIPALGGVGGPNFSYKNGHKQIFGIICIATELKKIFIDRASSTVNKFDDGMTDSEFIRIFRNQGISKLPIVIFFLQGNKW